MDHVNPAANDQFQGIDELVSAIGPRDRQIPAMELSNLRPDPLLFAHDRPIGLCLGSYPGAGRRTAADTQEQFGPLIQALIDMGLVAPERR